MVLPYVKMTMELRCSGIVFCHTGSKMFELPRNDFSRRNLWNCCRSWPETCASAAQLTCNLGAAGPRGMACRPNHRQPARNFVLGQAPQLRRRLPNGRSMPMAKWFAIYGTERFEKSIFQDMHEW